jgi:hypothetical protein
MENTLDRIDMQVLPEEARAILREFYLSSKVEKKESHKAAIIEDLLPKKVRNFVPMTREEIYGR